jgi:hypothetical protein
MENSVTDLINNIESDTLADAEQVFNDIMDIKAGTALDAYRQQIAMNVFNGQESEPEEESDTDVEDESEEDFTGEEDAEV